VLEGEVLIQVEALITWFGAIEFTDVTQNLVLGVGAGRGEALLS